MFILTQITPLQVYLETIPIALDDFFSANGIQGQGKKLKEALEAPLEMSDKGGKGKSGHRNRNETNKAPVSEFEKNIKSKKNLDNVFNHVTQHHLGKFSNENGIYGAHEISAFRKAVESLINSGREYKVHKVSYPNNNPNLGYWKVEYKVGKKNKPGEFLQQKESDKIFTKHVYTRRMFDDNTMKKMLGDAKLDAIQRGKLIEDGNGDWYGYAKNIKNGEYYKIAGLHENGRITSFWIDF